MKRATTIRLRTDDYSKLIQYQLKHVTKTGVKPRLTAISKEILEKANPEDYIEPSGPIPKDEPFVRLFVDADDSDLIKKWRHAGVDADIPYSFLIRNAIVASLESS